MKKHYYCSIAEIGRLLQAREISALQLVKTCLSRIGELNPSLNAFITVMGEEALEHAQKADEEIAAGKWRGPLHGVPVAVKDFYDTAGTPTTAAFEHFRNRVPQKDALIVSKLKEAGAIIIGKTNMDKLGMGTTSLSGYFGAVHNPWNTDYVAGGSSGGSAAAVAAGMCFATVDTDAIGSCRLPAACCGVTGFKTSYGLIDMQGILAGEKADDAILLLSQVGLTARSAGDTTILLHALANPAKKDNPSEEKAYRPGPGSNPAPGSNLPSGSIAGFGSNLPARSNKELKIGIVTNFKASDAIEQIFHSAVNVYKDLGYVSMEIYVPFGSASFNIQHIAADRSRIEGQLFNQADVLLLPVMTDLVPAICDAQKAGPQAVAADNTLFCNYFGLPAVSIPCGFDTNGLPVGLQIVGPPSGESDVLDAATAFQQATAWGSTPTKVAIP